MTELVGVDLSGRRAVVTGGASGIGAAICHRLAAAGATVVVLDRDGDGAESVASAIGGEAVVVDLTDGDAVDALGMQADVLVNNAGFQHVAPVAEFPPAVFEAIVAVMLTASFRLARQVMPGMVEQGWGRIINISSVHGLRASPFKAAYVAAKHGLEGLSKVLASEGGGHGVTSNCINPAYVRTPLVEEQFADQARTHGITEDEVLTEIMLTQPAVKRLIEPTEVAEMVAYLCSDQAGMVNGASWTIDGGWTAR